MMTADTYHVPVLLRESVDGLDIQPDGVYVDTTFGGGGHSKEILSRLGPKGLLFGFDQDEDAERNIGSMGQSPQGPRFIFVRSNFRYVRQWMRYHGISHIDGLLADLGVSSHHFDDAERGFSFRFNAPLDMRHTIDTTEQLLMAVEKLFAREREKKEVTKLFQALRIEVNHEMDALAQMLTAATSLLRPGGRLSVITYHSLEDRMVKNIIRSGRIDGRQQQDFFGRTSCALRPVGKPIVPTEAELQQNPRSRSAKLRIAEKTDN